MKKWKYAKKKASSFRDTFLWIPPDTPQVLTIKRFEILKKPIENVNKTVFQSDVIAVDGKETERIWTVFDYETVLALKKKLARKKGQFKLKVTKRANEETLEDYYEWEVIKEEKE